MKVLLIGGTGFLGKHVAFRLEKHGIQYTVASKSTGFDLTKLETCVPLVRSTETTHIINCAAFVGGIQYGYKFPGDIFRINTLMALNLLEISRQCGIRRVVNPISNCAYPADKSLFTEDVFWDGALHESVLAYGFSRKASWVGSWAYKKQFQTDWLNLVLSNMYGPGDHFDEERSHALGALVMKIVEAKRADRPSITVWGTGNPVREWLYVEDGAEALCRALTAPATDNIVNIGISSGISIADLTSLICEEVGYSGDIVYDKTKPDGAPYKTVDGSRGTEILQWQPSTKLREGIKKTIEWYVENKG